MASMLIDRINEYLQAGGLWNPDAMDHAKVRDLLIACRDVLIRHSVQGCTPDQPSSSAPAVYLDASTGERHAPSCNYIVGRGCDCGSADQPSSASACTCDGEYKYDGDCPVHGDSSFASDQPSAWREPRYHCQNGSGDICLAGNKDGICCAADECDIDDGTRPDPRATAQPGEAVK